MLPHIEPNLATTGYGKVLATTPRDCSKKYPRIGVLGDNDADARKNFHATMERWLESLGYSYPTGTDGDGI